MSKNKLTPKEKFDAAIKNNLVDDLFTYVIEEDGKKKREYHNYYSESAFADFVKEMKEKYPDHYEKFKGKKNASSNAGGKGGELDAQNSRPPKMASVASSSRFCYLALRDGADTDILGKTFTTKDVEFEKECRIFTKGTAPQLDAFIKDDERDIFVEAKCHEIFDSHKVEFKSAYWDYFDNDSLLKELAPSTKPSESFVVPFGKFDIKKESPCFDIKQFVCHLLGIKEHQKCKKAKLVYMFFKPVTDDKETATLIESVFKELKEEIEAIFKCDTIKEFCKNNNIELMAIAQKSKTMKKLDSEDTIYLYNGQNQVPPAK